MGSRFYTVRIKKLALAFFIVFGIVGGAASSSAEAELTAQEKFEALVRAGIFEGMDERGNAALDANMTRAQLAKVFALMMKLEEQTDGIRQSSFQDVDSGHWAAGYIDAVSAAGLMQGYGEGVFAPSGDVTLEQLAAVATRALGLDIEANAQVNGASAWAAPYVAAALEAGVLPPAADYTRAAQRELLVGAAYTANTVLAVQGGGGLLSKVYEETGKPVIQVDDYEATTREASVTIGGQIYPREGLTVAGAAASVDKLGRWSAPVELRPGSNTIAIEAVDALGATSRTSVTIKRDVAPTLSPIGDRSGIVGSSASVAVSGRDEDGDRLTYSASGLPGGIAIDADTGRMSGAPSAAGAYRVTVAVSDPGGQTAEQLFTWTVASPTVYSPPSGPPSNPPADTVIPIVGNHSEAVTVGDAVYGTSNEAGTAYLTYRNIDPKPTRAELEQLFANDEAAKQTVSAGIEFTFDSSSLSPGLLNIYVVDAAGNVSECAPVLLTASSTPPAILSIAPESMHVAGTPLPAVMNMDGKIYLVHSYAHSALISDGITQAELDQTQADYPQYVQSADALANETALIPTTGLDTSTYVIYAVDLAGNVSEPYSEIATIYNLD